MPRPDPRRPPEPATLTRASRGVNHSAGPARTRPPNRRERLMVWTVERRSIDNGWTRGVNCRDSGISRARGRRRPTRSWTVTDCRAGGSRPMGPAEIVASLKELCDEQGTAADHRADRRLDRRPRRLRDRRRADRLRQEDEGPAVRPDARVRGRGVGPADQAALELPRPLDWAGGSTPTSSRCPTTAAAG